MLRRSFLALTHRRPSIRRVPRQVSTQTSSFVCPQREFSSASQQNGAPGPGPTGKPTGSLGNLSKYVVGGLAIGTLITAYSRGYLDDILGKTQQNSADLIENHVGNTNTEELVKGYGSLHTSENSGGTIPGRASENPAPFDLEGAKESSEKQSVADSFQDSGKFLGEKKFSAATSADTKPRVEEAPVQEELLPNDDVHAKANDFPRPATTRDSTEDENLNSEKLEDSAVEKSASEEAASERHDVVEKLPSFSEANVVIQGNKMDKDMSVEPESEVATDRQGHGQEPATSLLEAYHLRDSLDERASTSSSGHDVKHSSPKDDSAVGASGDLSDVYVSKDGKLILDFLQAIHAAEQRQAELDARIFAEEKRAIKEKYEKELKDARARELMYAEEAAMLEKELEKERAKAAAALKSLQEKAEERLKMELEEKEREAESKLKELQEFAKVELAASLAREKAAQVEKMAEANLNINALCMAFYARSEEARQTHSVHKLALGALALEDALSNGQPVQAELEALQSYIESVDKDSLLQLALSSLPEDVRLHGIDSPLQLNEKFDKLKGSLRHFSLIPPDGGGILAHSLAYLASFLKVKESDQSGDGIESVINKVESLLAEGKLAEAADALENGVKGSKAAEVVPDWVRTARNRAITEQALILLQSYAASVSLT